MASSRRDHACAQLAAHVTGDILVIDPEVNPDNLGCARAAVERFQHRHGGDGETATAGLRAAVATLLGNGHADVDGDYLTLYGHGYRVVIAVANRTIVGYGTSAVAPRIDDRDLAAPTGTHTVHLDADASPRPVLPRAPRRGRTQPVVPLSEASLRDRAPELIDALIISGAQLKTAGAQLKIPFAELREEIRDRIDEALESGTFHRSDHGWTFTSEDGWTIHTSADLATMTSVTVGNQ